VDNNPDHEHRHVVPARDHVDVVRDPAGQFDGNDCPNQDFRLLWYAQAAAYIAGSSTYGQVVEAWLSADLVGLMMQIGAIPAPASA
jgi:hypothetical protein